MADLGDASDFGWNVGPLAVAATYEDLRSSGKLGLIQNPTLRTSIIAYYGLAESEDRRMIARKTQYPEIAYRIVPQSGELDPNQFGAGVEQADTRDAASIVAAVWASNLSDHIVAETNRALFVHGSVNLLRAQTLSLLGAIHNWLRARWIAPQVVLSNFFHDLEGIAPPPHLVLGFAQGRVPAHGGPAEARISCLNLGMAPIIFVPSTSAPRRDVVQMLNSHKHLLQSRVTSGSRALLAIGRLDAQHL